MFEVYTYLPNVLDMVYFSLNSAGRFLSSSILKSIYMNAERYAYYYVIPMFN